MTNKSSTLWSEQELKFKETYGPLLQELRDEKLVNARPVDYSFLSAQKKAKVPLSALAKAAAILLVFFTAVSGSVIFINSDVATATRFGIEKNFYKLKDGLFSTDPNSSITVDDAITLKIKSMDQIEVAKKLMPNLCVPNYLPDGQMFQQLQIEKNGFSEYLVNYIFQSTTNNEHINIIIRYTGEPPLDFALSTEGQIVKSKDRTFLFWEEPATNEQGIDILYDALHIRISGTISQDEKYKVAKSLEYI